MEVKLNMFLIYMAISIIFVVAKHEDLDACDELFDHDVPIYGIKSMCCLSIADRMSKNHEECYKGSKKGSCDAAKCILEKQGILSGDKIDEDKFLHMENGGELNEEQKMMMERVKDNCLNGQYKEYGPDDVCDYIKFELCAYLHATLSCKTWKDSEVCTKMSKSAEQCLKLVEAEKK